MSTFEPKFRTLLEIYRESTSRFRDRPLFGSKVAGTWRWMTYGEFAAQTDELRAGLASLGITAGDRVAVIANNRPEWAIAAYATYGLGASYVPMYESQKAEDWRYILQDCGAKVVVVANDVIAEPVEALAADIATCEHVVVCGDTDRAMSFDAVRARGRETPVEMADVDTDTVAGFIYTSGTTGKPKGVLLRHSNLASNVSAMHEVFPMEPDDRSLSFLPWAHSFGQTVELHGLYSMGASIGIAESVPKIIDNLAEVQPTLLFSVPRIFNRLHDRVNKTAEESGGLRRWLFHTALGVAERKSKLAAERRRSGFVDFQHGLFDRLVFRRVRGRLGGRLKYAFSGGAAISKEVAEFIDRLGITVYEGYGLTETSPIATANWPGARKIGSVGKALPGLRIEIDRSATEDPTSGEIVVHGHCVMLGYHNLPEENAKVFTEEGGFRTGDIGYLDDDGFLYVTGRIKEQYKLENGKYVVPAPLEEQVQLSPYIISAFIDGTNKPHNVALLVVDRAALEDWASKNGVSASGDALLQHEKVRALYAAELEKQGKSFKGYERPKAFTLIGEEFSVENGLLTPKMSVKRRKVQERYGEMLAALYR